VKLDTAHWTSAMLIEPSCDAFAAEYVPAAINATDLDCIVAGSKLFETNIAVALGKVFDFHHARI
jgi:hypothetical protein